MRPLSQPELSHMTSFLSLNSPVADLEGSGSTSSGGRLLCSLSVVPSHAVGAAGQKGFPDLSQRTLCTVKTTWAFLSPSVSGHRDSPALPFQVLKQQSCVTGSRLHLQPPPPEETAPLHCEVFPHCHLCCLPPGPRGCSCSSFLLPGTK